MGLEILLWDQTSATSMRKIVPGEVFENKTKDNVCVLGIFGILGIYFWIWGDLSGLFWDVGFWGGFVWTCLGCFGSFPSVNQTIK